MCFLQTELNLKNDSKKWELQFSQIKKKTFLKCVTEDIQILIRYVISLVFELPPKN